MWGIDNPWSVFKYIYQRNFSKQFNFMCVINEMKWNTFQNVKELETLAEKNKDLLIQDVRIKNPDNPAQLVNAKLISFSV